MRLDLLAATVVGVFVAVTGRDLDPIGYVIVGLAAAALAGLRKWPWIAFVVTASATVAYAALGYPDGPVYLTLMIAVFGLAVSQPAKAAAAGAAVVAGFHVPLTLLLGREGVLDTVVTWSGWVVAPLGVGVAVRTARLARLRAAEQERQQREYQQRLDLAQAVHDVVGHDLAVICLHAGVALHVLARRPTPDPEVDVALRAIRRAGTGALDEVRAVLARFTDQVPRESGPGLARLPELVAASRVGDLRVALDVTGEARPVPVVVDILGYRIVQEALANVIRHADARRATVGLRYQPEAVEVSVRDDGRGGPVDPSGTGLASMRDRVAAAGGTLTAGCGADGPGGTGFAVVARLPTSPANQA